MTINVLSAAKHLAKRSGWTLSNLELQKILYLTHMFHLGRNNGEPLVHGLFEAWDYGPVHPDLYRRAKIFGSDPVENIFHGDADVPEGAERAILDEAYDSLGHAGPGKLVRATHSVGGAWHTNYVPGRRHCVIPNEDILAEYQTLKDAH
ncbi:MAG: type II toxin-antitoxin system antitoxin SocA domain-containing protein [Aestuariivirga sp.]